MADGARSDHPGVQAQLDRLSLLSPGRDVLGLERITALMERLGNPHRKLPPVFHVAGTNGKGSTCAFLRAMIEVAGLSAHVYTSPHLVRFNERIRVAGKLIEDKALAPLLAEVLDCSADIAPSFFEATTAAAFLAFSRTPADACVIEVGLGGRLDATNVIEKPLVCGIAQIGIDHQVFLGSTLESIAYEKAGIGKRGVPLVCLEQKPEAQAAIKRACWISGANLSLEGRDWPMDPTLRPGLAGAHQVRNGNLAKQMATAIAPHSGPGWTESSRVAHALASDAVIRAGMASAHWPGRLQRLSPGPLAKDREIWIDGAHNEAAAFALAVELRKRSMHLVLGILANKDADGIVKALAPHGLSLTFVEVPGHASNDPNALAHRFGGKVAESIKDALRGFAASREPILIAGSLYLAGEVLKANGQIPE